MPAFAPPGSFAQPAAVQSIRDTLHTTSAPLVERLASLLPKPVPVADSALVGELHRLVETLQQGAETSVWDYLRDISGLIIAAASVYVAIRLFLSQRRQQLKDTRLAWIRLFIIEPNSELILKFFADLESVLTKANHSPLLPDERTAIFAEINSRFVDLDNEFLSYTDSIENSTIPQQLREISENQQDVLAYLIDTFEDSDQAGSYKRLIAQARLGRNKFLATIYSLSFE